jgi:hypothetical protein
MISGACTIKLIMAVIYGFSSYARVFVHGKPFQSSQMFSGAPLYGRPLALPTKIRLGWKSLPGTNTLVYYKNM